MGRMLYDPDEELDRPDLNKCPDCGCYFAGDNCPLCGKLCPEEMRAGNRKKVKPKKKKGGNSSGRVTFVAWYHSWWFILLATLVMPVVGIVLFATSPYKKSVKITVVILIAVYVFVLPLLLQMLLPVAVRLFDRPVDSSMTREEYVSACETVEPITFYRGAAGYEERFVTMTLVVDEVFVGYEDSFAAGTETYYLCYSAAGGDYRILLRDCQLAEAKNLMPGDVITVYGEGAGNITVYGVDYSRTESAPCLNAAYVTVQ